MRQRRSTGCSFDGMTIAAGGFGLCGIPELLIAAIRDSGVKDLTVASNNCRRRRLRPRRSAADASRSSKMISSYVGENAEFMRQYLSGELELEFNPQGTLAERMRAGGAGIPGFYTRTGVGTVIAEGKEHKEFDGETYILERGLVADLAIVKAWKGDEQGNLVYRKTARNFNPNAATCGRVCVAEVEEIVPLGIARPRRHPHPRHLRPPHPAGRAREAHRAAHRPRRMKDGEAVAEAVPPAVPAQVPMAALTGLPLALVLTNPGFEDNPIVYANAAFTRLTGYTIEAAVGRNCRFLQGPETEPERGRRDPRGVRRGQGHLDRDHQPPRRRLDLPQPPDDNPGPRRGRASATSSARSATGDDGRARTRVRVRLQLAEVQHRVKNHLAMIVGMIRMQARSPRAPATTTSCSRGASRRCSCSTRSSARPAIVLGHRTRCRSAPTSAASPPRSATSTARQGIRVNVIAEEVMVDADHRRPRRSAGLRDPHQRLPPRLRWPGHRPRRDPAPAAQRRHRPHPDRRRRDRPSRGPRLADNAATSAAGSSARSSPA